MKLKMGIGMIALVAAGIWLAQVLASDDKGATAGPDFRGYEVNLSGGQTERLEATALDDSTVRHITEGREVSVVSVYPWTENAGAKLKGAVVELALAPSVELVDQRLPVSITPGPNAPAETPELHRTVVLSASNVNRLDLEIELSGWRVVEIVPSGHARISDARLLGPPVSSRLYGGKGD